MTIPRTPRVPPFRPLDHILGGDAVARHFGSLTGREMSGALSWLKNPRYVEDVALATRAYRMAGAQARFERWFAPIHVEQQALAGVAFLHDEDDLFREHHAADANDDHWRFEYLLGGRTAEARRMWLRTLSQTLPLQQQVIARLRQIA